MPKNEEEPFMAGTMASAGRAVKRPLAGLVNGIKPGPTAELMIFNILALSVSVFRFSFLVPHATEFRGCVVCSHPLLRACFRRQPRVHRRQPAGRLRYRSMPRQWRTMRGLRRPDVLPVASIRAGKFLS